MQYNGNSYKIALETIMKKVYPKFYRENYHNLIMEYQAEYVGLEQAIKMMQIYYNIKFGKGQNIDEFLNEWLISDVKESYENLGEVSFQQINVNASALINFAADQYIKKSPKIISRIPVLKFAYNPDGNKKDIIQLIQDRTTLISGNPQMDLETIDDLYKTIANYKSITKDEMLELYSYITDEGIEDEFAYDLLQHRLEKTNWNQEKISNFMQQTRQDVTRIRQERELISEQEEGIMDEVGEEFKPQTQAKEQDEQQATTEWMHRIGTIAQDVDKTNNGAKGKQEVAKLIKDLDRKQQKEQGQEQEAEQQDFLKAKVGKNMREEYLKAFSEVEQIIKLMPVTLQKKIPDRFKNIISTEKSRTYRPHIEETFEECNIMEETKIILALIYRDFLCSEQEKKK